MLNTDKATALRRKAQIAGAIVMIEGELRSLMLQNTVVPADAGGGFGLARLLVDSILTVCPSVDGVRTRCSSIGADGQYLQDGVGRHFREIVGASNGWLHCLWDPAHKLELLVEDIKKDREAVEDDDGTTEELVSVAWVNAINKTVTTALSAFQTGKGYQELVQVAEEMLSDMRSPKKLCETRFVASALTVFKNMAYNFRFYVELWTKASTIPDGAKTRGGRPRTERNKEEKAAYATLTALKSMTFIGRLLLLTDFYEKLTEVKVQYIPFNVQVL
eukprot:GHVU01228813.1.p1 GENE.GHVU01228813.1~~GHVU01228813.1.p1  ORF type:complete len:275 (+),score=47.16 GHVU01228813.1:412-1236(+)